ncbi:MAG: FG-GAP-like repeat-containing protein, partial [Sandaracinaceae bacterium]|nr:FG-GAP-like repeat-containing protein [Sandaracinaceae bacterium]
IDFEDPEIRLADMNGDGIQDIVQISRGRVRYWPGRGLGVWGEGPSTCARGQGAGREITMQTPPRELNVELAGVYLDDLNQDGAADVVQVRFDAVDVWVNRAGQGFTERVILRDTPRVPAFAPRVRFADIDGSGTTDIVFGTADGWQWIDPLGGQRPRLLTHVDNGLGALTTLEYGSSATEYLRDLAAVESCSGASLTCDRFTWNGQRDTPDQFLLERTGLSVYRSGGSPVLSTVVTRVSTTDRLDSVGRTPTVSSTSYAYHDGYYEGIEQEFRGFGAADAIVWGTGTDGTDRTGATRTWFHQGRRPTELATDRLADNRYEALKGREYRTESWDYEDGHGNDGARLSTTHSTYTVRTLLTGLDGRMVQYAYVNRTDELRYDVSLLAGTGGTQSFPSVVWQEVTDGATIPADSGTDAEHVVPVRGLGAITVRSTVDIVDNRG